MVSKLRIIRKQTVALFFIVEQGSRCCLGTKDSPELNEGDGNVVQAPTLICCPPDGRRCFLITATIDDHATNI